MTKLTRLGYLAAGLILAFGFFAAGSPAQASTKASTDAAVQPAFLGSAFALVSLSSGKCVEVEGGSLFDNAPLVQNDCHPDSVNVTDPNQNWLPVSVGGGFFNLRNVRSNLCMDFAAPTLGHNVKHHLCKGDLSERWQIVVSEVPGFLRIISANHSGGHTFCLDNGGTANNGAVSVIWDCQNGNFNQLYRQA